MLGRVVLKEDRDDLGLLRNSARHGRLVTSSLTRVELARAILRAKVTGRLPADQFAKAREHADAWLRRFTILEMDAGVLARAASPFEVEPVKSLDAIHLATAFLLKERTACDLVLLTRDARVAANACALGITVR